VTSLQGGYEQPWSHLFTELVSAAGPKYTPERVSVMVDDEDALLVLTPSEARSLAAHLAHQADVAEGVRR
jgi:hypothetical protein